MNRLKKKFLDWLFADYSNDFLNAAKSCIEATNEVIDLNNLLTAKNDEILRTSGDILNHMEIVSASYKILTHQHIALIEAINEHEDSEAILSRSIDIWTNFESEIEEVKNNDKFTKPENNEGA